MSALHKCFEKYIDTNDMVLDLGFGSGRDLIKIYEITSNVYGLDSCAVFIENMSKTMPVGHIGKTILPEINLDGLNLIEKKFDVIVSIAVLMHLTLYDMERTIQNIKRSLGEKGIVIISYSLKRDIEDGRYFEDITKEIMLSLFNKYGFQEIDSYMNNDSMNRKIQWVTQVLKL